MNAERLEAPEPGLVGGVFGDEKGAAEAVSRLVEARFEGPELQVVNAHRREHEWVPVMENFLIGRNAMVGAALGAFLGLVAAAVVLLGLVPAPVGFFSPTPGLALFQGLYLGAVGGYGLGAVSGLSQLREEARPERARVHGVTWVGVRAEGRAEEAREILRSAGARHFTA